jgi:REP element-mobilizing transposase RayT
MHFKDGFHFITNRCVQEQFLLLPTEQNKALITEWMARALTFVGGKIEIHAFIFLSNHFHILLRDTGGQVARFMGYFQGNLAKAVNEKLGRKGVFWGREYDDMLIGSDEDYLNRYAYTLCNAVKAGLVDEAAQWPGFSSLDMARRGKAMTVRVLNRTKLHNATRRGQKVDEEKFYETHTIEVAKPPMWSDLTVAKRAKRIDELLRAGDAKYRALRAGKPALGVKRIMSQGPYDRPRKPSHRPRIKVFSLDREVRKELLDAYRRHNGGYREVLHEFVKASLLGKRPVVEWPRWSYPPSSAMPMGFGLTA